MSFNFSIQQKSYGHNQRLNIISSMPIDHIQFGLNFIIMSSKSNWTNLFINYNLN